MKKIVKTLLMLTCVLGLTACGSEESLSEMQQSKVTAAEDRAVMVVNMTTVLVETGDVNEVLADYNNIELGDVYASTFAQFSGDSSFICDGKGVRSALTSFDSGLETMGAIAELGEASSVVDGDTIIVNIPVKGEKAEGSVELIFTNDIYLKMTACTLNLNESLAELMVRAALNTLIGMGTVFAVLILISLIIACFGFIPKLQEKFAKKEEIPAVTSTPAIAVEEEEELADDTELVAVIAAAIAAYEGTSADGFQVRSIKRASTKKWQRA